MKGGIITAMAIVLGIGGMTMSCEKEQIKPTKESKVKTPETQAKDGGDDDDDPVIRGKIRKSNLTFVDNASVETFEYGTDEKIGTTYTDELGDYGQKVTAGIYYLKVTNLNSNNYVFTDTVHVDKDDVILNVTVD